MASSDSAALGVAALDNRPTLTYPGDTTSTLGQVVGPTLAGEWLIIDAAHYHADINKTTVWLRYATADDIAKAAGR